MACLVVSFAGCPSGDTFWPNEELFVIVEGDLEGDDDVIPASEVELAFPIPECPQPHAVIFEGDEEIGDFDLTTSEIVVDKNEARYIVAVNDLPLAGRGFTPTLEFRVDGFCGGPEGDAIGSLHADPVTILPVRAVLGTAPCLYAADRNGLVSCDVETDQFRRLSTTGEILSEVDEPFHFNDVSLRDWHSTSDGRFIVGLPLREQLVLGEDLTERSFTDGGWYQELGGDWTLVESQSFGFAVSALDATTLAPVWTTEISAANATVPVVIAASPTLVTLAMFRDEALVLVQVNESGSEESIFSTTAPQGTILPFASPNSAGAFVVVSQAGGTLSFQRYDAISSTPVATFAVAGAGSNVLRAGVSSDLTIVGASSGSALGLFSTVGNVGVSDLPTEVVDLHVRDNGVIGNTSEGNGFWLAPTLDRALPVPGKIVSDDSSNFLAASTLAELLGVDAYAALLGP
ncbi:MAG: hypothetical protein ACO3JL_17525 [Myxococcota bacterium]